jgi:uncharacterized protein (DUF1499 family)
MELLPGASKHLAGCGAESNRLGAEPVHRDMAKVQPGLTSVAAVGIIEQYVVGEIAISDTGEFLRRRCEAQIMNVVDKLEFRFEGSNQDAPRA